YGDVRKNRTSPVRFSARRGPIGAAGPRMTCPVAVPGGHHTESTGKANRPTTPPQRRAGPAPHPPRIERPCPRASSPTPRTPYAPIRRALLLGRAAGYALPRRARRGGDLLDAAGRVQRRRPLFLVSEPLPQPNWFRQGALYLCRSPRDARDLDLLSRRPGPGWAGVVCLRGTTSPSQSYMPWVSDGGAGCLRYGAFAAYGDPEL